MGATAAEPKETTTTSGAPATAGARFALAPEDLAWLSVIAGAIALVAALLWLAPPLAKLYPEPLTNVFQVWKVAIAPEPLEDVRAMIALATPLLLAAIVLGLGSRIPPRPSLGPLILIAQVAGIGFLAWAVLEQSANAALVTPATSTRTCSPRRT